MRKKLYRSGFTLIELLAVVLMIGILTSIALPQYRRSVQRAEAMEAMVNLRSLFDAARRYRAANDAAPTSLKGLDVTFFDAAEISGGFELGKFRYHFYDDYIEVSPLDGGYGLLMFYNHPTYGKDTLLCGGDTTGKYAEICDRLGGDSVGGGMYLIK